MDAQIDFAQRSKAGLQALPLALLSEARTLDFRRSGSSQAKDITT
jgi:hypothetical protein